MFVLSATKSAIRIALSVIAPLPKLLATGMLSSIIPVGLAICTCTFVLNSLYPLVPLTFFILALIVSTAAIFDCVISIV